MKKQEIKRLVSLFMISVMLVMTIASCGLLQQTTEKIKEETKQETEKTPEANENPTREPIKEGTEGVVYSISADGTYYAATGYEGTETDIIIAEEYKGLPVRELNGFLFSPEMTSVRIPDTIMYVNKDMYHFESVFYFAPHLFNEDENAYYLGNEENPYLILVGIKRDAEINGTFTINERTKVVVSNVFNSWWHKVEHLIIPDSVVSLNYGAFSSLEYLKTVSIGSGVAYIDTGVFACCRNLVSIDVKEENRFYKSVNGDLYSKDGATLLQYSSGKPDVSFVIPDYVRNISDFAFSFTPHLRSITVGKNVSNIAEYAFSGMYPRGTLLEIVNNSVLDIQAGSKDNGYIGLDVLDVRSGESKLIYQGDYVFYPKGDDYYFVAYNGAEKDVVLPEYCKGNSYKIYSYAFYGDILSSVTIPASVSGSSENAFYGQVETQIYCEANYETDKWEYGWNPHNCSVRWHYNADHSWVEATNELPKHCSRCFCLTSGRGHDHICDNEVCQMCGKAIPKARYDVPEEGYDGSAVTITFYHTMGQALQNQLDAAIARFNEIYPNITVEHSQVGGYDDVRDQIKQDLVADSQPNIAYCYPDHVALYNLTGKVVPLDNFIESKASDGLGGALGFTQTQIDNFIDGYYAEGTVFDAAGTMYTLPMSKSTEVMYYNKTFFEQEGLSVPKTWAELEAVCAYIKNKYPDSIPLGYDSEANWFITMCAQYGSDYTTNQGYKKFLFDNESNRAFVKMFREWFDKGYFTTQEIYGAYTSDLFVNEKCYICIGSSAGAAYQVPPVNDGVVAFEMGVAPIPQVNAAAPKAISHGGSSLCIFDSADKQEVVASWLFVKFLTTDVEFQASFSMASGYIPVIEREVLIQAAPFYGTWLASGDPIPTTIEVALSQKDAYFVSPAFNGSSKARDAVGKLMQYCFTTPATDIDAMILQAFKDSVAECEADA
jgi:multiple sugar transport system substrate-binding protein